MNLKQNVNKGRTGELFAEKYLINSGYKIIEKNLHYSRNAEIDIIAEDAGILVFVEVKTRTALNFGHPFEAITPSKLRKINTAIYGYLSKTQKKYKSFRIDAIAIVGFVNPKIEHIKNIGQF